MQVVAETTEDHMIAAFLRAEIDSRRFGGHYRALLDAAGWPRRIVDEPDLTDDEENGKRRAMLFCVRGYPSGVLFAGFPPNVNWSLAVFAAAEISDLFYLPVEPWGRWSQGTRLVGLGAQTVHKHPENPEFRDIQGVLALLREGMQFPELVCVSSRPDGPFVLVEGHTRATAYALAGAAAPAEVRAFVGISGGVLDWPGFQLAARPG